MIITRHGNHVKWVALLDERRGICTVVGYQKQVYTFPISEMRSTNELSTPASILEELRDSHANYLQMREDQRAPSLEELESERQMAREAV